MQSPPAMSERERGRLSQEEFEIHQALSNSGSSTDSVPPGQRHPKDNVDHSYANKNLPKDKDKIKNMYSKMKGFMSKIDQSGFLEDCFGASDASDGDHEEDDAEGEFDDEGQYDDDGQYDEDEGQYDDAEGQYDDAEEDTHMPSGLPATAPAAKLKSFFGLSVNEPNGSEVEFPSGTNRRAPCKKGAVKVDDNNNDPSLVVHVPTPSHSAVSVAPVKTVAAPKPPFSAVRGTPAVSSTPPAPGITPAVSSAPPAVIVVEAPVPDPDLPLPTTRHPKNWEPDPSVIAWATKTSDTCEWTKEDRDFLSAKFSSDPATDFLFSAVPNPPDLLAAIKSPLLLKRDYLLKRADTEQFLFDANEDLASGFRPLLDALSSLKGKGMDDLRTNLAYVYQSMSSAICKISRGRRELGRRFVPLVTAPALFRTKPSPLCLFGSNSIEEAIEKAVETKKVNKDLVYVPKRKKLYIPSHGSKNYGNMYKGRGQGPKYYNYNSGKDFFHNKRSSRGRSHRRGRRGRGSQQQSSAETNPKK